MKGEPEKEVENGGDETPITGDVIGETAYSERFVLKILLKLANRDTLKEEINKPTFEEELCTLWDMAVERDVVLYLQKHDTLNLFCFALPAIESSRIIEVIIGTIANMCCHKEVVRALMANKDLLLLLLSFMKSEDSQILNQLMRLINSCLYTSSRRDMRTWMDMFENVDYAQSLYFILMNSTNKELLMTALENLNAICMTSRSRGSEKFPLLFETDDCDALKAVYTAHREYMGQTSAEENVERLHHITLQMMVHLECTQMIKNQHKKQPTPGEDAMNTLNLIRDILTSYTSKVNEYYKFNKDFSTILDYMGIMIRFFEKGQTSSPDQYFNSMYIIWKAFSPNGKQGKGERMQFIDDIIYTLGLSMCKYMSQCGNAHLLNVLNNIGDDYGCIVSQIDIAELQAEVANRALIYRNAINKC